MPTALTGTSWLEGLEGTVSPGTQIPPTLKFTPDGTVNGFGTCNSYSGRFQESGNTVRISTLQTTTNKSCSAADLSQEEGFLQALGEVETWQVNASTGRPERLARQPIQLQLSGREPMVFTLAVMVSDGFERSTSSGWGAPDVGPAWVAEIGNAPDFSVADGAGVMTPTGIGWDQMVAPVGLLDTEVLASLWWTGEDPHAVEVFTRYSSNTVRYATTIWWSTASTFEVSIDSNNGPIASRKDTRITRTAGQKYWLRIRTAGANPTSLKCRFWQDGMPEPSAWFATATDSTSALQIPGNVVLEGGGFRTTVHWEDVTVQ